MRPERPPSEDEHDRIVRYLMQPKTAKRLCRRVFDLEVSRRISVDVATEVPLRTDWERHQKRPPHAYADVVIECTVACAKDHECVRDHMCGSKCALCERRRADPCDDSEESVLVEVKSGRVHVGEVQRQLTKYNEIVRADALVLVAPQMDATTAQHLRDVGVHPFVIGKKYLDWVNTAATKAEEL